MGLLDKYGIDIGPVQLDQTKQNDDVIDIDFKDRDGNWVLRFRDKDHKFYQTRLGKLHNNMTQRAKGNYDKFTDAYNDVGLSPLFSDPQKFCDWAVKQVGWGLGYQLDKDLLGGRAYTEDNCVFLPSDINSLIAKKVALPRRLRETSKKFTVKVKIKSRYLSFSGPSFDALSEVSKDVRKCYLANLAEAYRPMLDVRAYDALLALEPVLRHNEASLPTPSITL